METKSRGFNTRLQSALGTDEFKAKESSHGLCYKQKKEDLKNTDGPQMANHGT